MIAGWFNANYNSLLKKEKTYLDKNAQKSAFNQVMSYFNNNDKILKKVKEAEVEVALVKPEYILKGTIDLIQDLFHMAVGRKAVDLVPLGADDI